MEVGELMMSLQDKALQILWHAAQQVKEGETLESIEFRPGEDWPDGEDRYVITYRGEE